MHTAVAATILHSSRVVRRVPILPKRFFSSSTMAVMPQYPAMDVAKARPFAPMNFLRMTFSATLMATTMHETRKGVFVSFSEWNTRLKKSRRPKAGMPMM